MVSVWGGTVSFTVSPSEDQLIEIVVSSSLSLPDWVESLPSYNFKVTVEVPEVLASGMLSKVKLSIGDVPVEGSDETILAKMGSSQSAMGLNFTKTFG